MRCRNAAALLTGLKSEKQCENHESHELRGRRRGVVHFILIRVIGVIRGFFLNAKSQAIVSAHSVSSFRFHSQCFGARQLRFDAGASQGGQVTA